MTLSNEIQQRQRITSLQQKQLQDRAPKTGKATRGTSARKQQRPLLIELFDIFPTTWKGVIVGLIVGLVPSYLISVSTTDTQKLLTLVPLIGCMMAGYVVGVVIPRLSKK